MSTIVEDDLLPGRAAASGVTLSIGPTFSFQVDLASMQDAKSDDIRFPFACPDHDGEVFRVEQRYQCTEGHLHPQKELLRARESDEGTLVHASSEEIGDLLTGGLEKAVLELRIHPRSEVERIVRPGDLGYRVRPGKKGSRKPYAILKAMASDPDNVLVGWMRLKDSRRLFTVEVWNGQVVLQALADVARQRGVDTLKLPELSDAEVEGIASMLEDAAEPFERADYEYDASKAIAEFVAKRAADPDAAVPVSAAAVDGTDDDNIVSMLQASLAGAGKKKAPAKKAAAKSKARRSAA